MHVGCRILRERGFPEEIVEAVASHADYMGIPRDTPLKKALYGCDELVGFIGACVKVRPTKKLADLPVDSVLAQAQGQGLRPLGRPRLRLRRRRGARAPAGGARRLRDRGARADRRRARPLGAMARASLVQDVFLGFEPRLRARRLAPWARPRRACSSSSTR